MLGFIEQFFLFLWIIFLLPQIVSIFFEDAGCLEFYFGMYLDVIDFIFKNAELYAGRQYEIYCVFKVCELCEGSFRDGFTLGLSSITEGVFLLWSELHFHSDKQLCSLADGKWKAFQLCESPMKHRVPWSLLIHPR